MTDSEHMQATIQKAMRYLAQEQGKDGSFLGWASQQHSDFSSHVIHYSPFFTSLIACSLADIPGARTVQQKAASFLLSNKDSDWAWNYWLPGSQDAKARPYPNDLDDTACALAAVQLSRPEALDGSALGSFARHLISQETRVSGPYTTWLVQGTAAATWKDVDPAVNANIGYFLSLHDVHLEGLTNYISVAIKNNTLTSRYYIGIIPVLYFIARWYNGDELPKLRSLILKAISDEAHAGQPASLAMLITAACKAGIPRMALIAAGESLLGTMNGHHWKAQAIYYEPDVDGKRYYAGSDALTTALAIEALQLLHGTQPTASRALSTYQSPAPPRAAFLPKDRALRTVYTALFKRIIERDRKHEIATIASVVTAATGKTLPQRVLTQLNLGSINGWIAYTVYDDILDGEDAAVSLGAANVAHRRMLQNFYTAVPNAEYIRYVHQALDTIDAANLWEVQHARNGTVEYGSYLQLANRSRGHMLAPLGVLVALGYSLTGPEAQQFQLFFEHYIIARQLNDDAHDWEEDVRNGHVSAAVAELLHDAGLTIVAAQRQPNTLRLVFWETTITKLCSDISEHCGLARRALLACPVITTPDAMLTWITALESSAAMALSERNASLSFMRSYSKPIQGKSVTD